ncbi:MAG: HAD-superfamily subfamily hydrolase [Pseudonocardiales bacterium]|jgi:putative phosphoserine phosphatase/1-acylglycerol-3-phosphate O-acyltransferase|nr:HAD-superfamily subfamily hydrolase [Pseudonocardiales bacterium]MDT4905803.1 putative phosphoserine phosphatase / 1-acylglycerol-3-phosphate O-acyltransferase [Pseudonocardiales bacterium]MDT4947789.1 putative phosphoserine phosphatase / 1-acylglycerol-3-phosphate O-acyltransferase [Pseudonocardiales bacterium]
MAIEALLDAIKAGPAGPSVGAFFDFDGTLIDGYSASALYAHRFRNFEIGPAEMLHTLRATLGGSLSEEGFEELISRGIQGWTGRTPEDIEELGDRLFVQGIAGTLFHGAWRVVKAHQRQGHTVVIATSATRFQVAPMARELGIEHVLCTELESEGGVLTGRLHGRTLWGRGKLAAVQSFAERHDLDLSLAYGYANGDEDVPFLSAIGRPRAVNPQPELALEAQRQGWPAVTFRRGPGRFDPTPALRTAAMYTTLLGAGAVGVVTGLLSGSRRHGIDTATSLFAHVGSAVGDVRVEVMGAPHLWTHRPAVFMINHQSALIDLLVATTLLRGGFTGVAKKEVASVPVIGQLLTLAEFAFLDRADGTQARQALDQASERLARGTSIVISPEGTRSLTPSVGRFKKGAFHLAMQAGVPIVPIVIRNAGELMSRAAKTARSGTVEVFVHEPIVTTGWTKQDLDTAVDRVHGLYRETLEDWPASRERTDEAVRS